MADKWSARLLRTRAQVQTLIAGSGLNYPGFYQISDAVGATKQILVWATSANTITGIAQNLTDDQVGIYDITADTFTEGYIPTTGTPYKMLQYDASGVIGETNKFSDSSGNISVQVEARQLLGADGAVIVFGFGAANLIPTLNTVITQGSIANNAAAITAGLTQGQLYYTNVAGEGILKIVI